MEQKTKVHEVTSNNKTLDILLRIDTTQLQEVLSREKVVLNDILDLATMQVLTADTDIINLMFYKLNEKHI